jgi:predicted DNA-binding transcriptional regulator AlpA
MMPASLPRQDGKFGTMQQVAAHYGGTVMLIYRRMKNDPTFPKPVYFGNVKKPYFIWKEIEAWDAAAIAARDGEAA